MPHFAAATSAGLVETVGDFNVVNATGSPTSVSVLPGNSASLTFTLSPVGTSTLAAAVALSVSGLPPGSTASLSPPVVAAGSGPTTVLVTVNVPTGSAAAVTPPRTPWDVPIAFGLLAIPLMAIRSRRKLRAALAVLVLCGLTAGLSGCFGNVQSGYFGVSPHTYTVTLTGTSGSLSHSASGEVVVQ